jgi:hypothetical protein
VEIQLESPELDRFPIDEADMTAAGKARKPALVNPLALEVASPITEIVRNLSRLSDAIRRAGGFDAAERIAAQFPLLVGKRRPDA